MGLEHVLVRPKHKRDKKGQRKKSYRKPPKWFVNIFHKKFRRRAKMAVDAEKEPPTEVYDCSWHWD